MTRETPVLDTLADLPAASVEHNSLAPREFMLARMAALIAVDAPPASYLANAGTAADSGVSAGDIQAVMIAVAPVVGTARVVSAGGTSSGLWAWRSLWPTPSRSAVATPGSSSNRAHPAWRYVGQDNRDRELEVIAVEIGAGQEGFLLVTHVRPDSLLEAA